MKNQLENYLGPMRLNYAKLGLFVKFGLVGVLTLILLVPSALVQNLIQERQQRKEEVVNEISDKWAAAQLVEGPVMVIPYRKMVVTQVEGQKPVYKEEERNIYLLPEVLNFQGTSSTEIRHRSIFEASVYTAMVRVSGKFGALDLKSEGIQSDAILWSKAKVVVGLSDLKGLKNYPKLTLGGRNYEIVSDFAGKKMFSNNLMAQADLTKEASSSLSFGFNLELKGTNAIRFRHLGKLTQATMKGNWASPGFSGRYLPEKRVLSDSGFTASWRMSYFDRPFSQQSVDEPFVFDKHADKGVFGVKFVTPVDQYQMTMRSAKYAILIIVLTFIALYFAETLSGKGLALHCYLLIGSSLVVYYVLLLSISEYLGFTAAYCIASGSVILMVSLFLAGMLRSRTLAFSFAAILSFYYAFIYGLIRMQDGALLVGSVALFVIISILMYMAVRAEHRRSEDLRRQVEGV